MEQCLRRGVDLSRVPDSWVSNLRWVASSMLARARRFPCARCGTHGSTHYLCSTCPLAYCHACLHLDKDSCWNIGWECAACSIESLLPSTSVVPLLTERHDLFSLADRVVQALAQRLQPSTWRLYHRCVSHVLHFCQSTSMIILPVTTHACAVGLCFFFTHLAELGFSWGRIVHY